MSFIGAILSDPVAQVSTALLAAAFAVAWCRRPRDLLSRKHVIGGLWGVCLGVLAISAMRDQSSVLAHSNLSSAERPVAVSIKGTVRYVDEELAHRHAASKWLLLAFCFGFVIAYKVAGLDEDDRTLSSTGHASGLAFGDGWSHVETLSQDQIKRIASLVADRSLAESERESQASLIAGSQVLAWRALEWLPEAFGLVALGRIEGLKLPTTFSARRRDGAWQEFPLSAEPLFAQAIALAVDPDVPFKAIAEQGSCVNAVDNALNAGASVHGAIISGPALVRVPAEAYLPPRGFNQVGV